MNVGNLAAWGIDPSAFPASASAIDKARFAVGYAILAPSSHNTQPWRFIINGDELLVCADRTRSLPNIDPFDRELIISCGAALFNLRVAFAHFNVPVEIATFPQSSDPDIVARIIFPDSGPKLNDLAKLFDAITKRATNRGPFVAEDVPNTVIDRLKTEAALEGIDLAFAQTLAERERIAALIAKADRRQFDDPHFRRELASWIHPSRKNDGMPADPRVYGSSPMPRRPLLLWLFVPLISVMAWPRHMNNWPAARPCWCYFQHQWTITRDGCLQVSACSACS